MLRKLDADWLQTVYDREVQYSTAEFPMSFVEKLPNFARRIVEPMAYNVMKTALKFKVDFETELRWQKSSYDGQQVLQVRGIRQMPIVRHHFTGEAAWWGSM